MKLEELQEQLIGKTREEAEQITSLRVRPTRVDGQPTVCTRDYRLDRINVETLDGIITKVTNFG